MPEVTAPDAIQIDREQDGAVTPQLQPAVSRRSLIARLGRAAGSAMVPAAAVAGVLAVSGKRAAAAPPDVPADVDPGSLVVKLASRITFGVNAAELALANSLGYSGYLEYHLAHENIAEDAGVTARVASLATMSYTGQQLYDPLLVSSQTQVANELIEATIYRAVFSKRQLLERMVEFWGDHFNIDITQEDLPVLKSLNDRSIRSLALTTFPQLLNASARSPVMLAYLDNDQSSNGLINENYGREVMELHTVGADYLYSFPQTDVQATIVAVARCLTGWGRYGSGFNDTSPGGSGTALRGQFYFNPTTTRNRVTSNGVNLGGATAGVHDTGAKTLGTIFGAATIPAGRTGAAGIQDGQDVLNLLAAHPATAAYIALKLCRRFLGEGVPQSTVDAVRDAYLNPGNAQGIGDIKAMLRVMLSPNNLAASAPRFKRPFHLFASMMRAVPTTIGSVSSLRTRLSQAGHTPFFWGPPDGYPDTTDYWTGLVLPRWNFGASLVTATNGNAVGISGLTVDDVGFFTGATSATQVMDRIDSALFLSNMPAGERALIAATLPATPSATQKRDALGLAFSSPAFQWY